MEGPQYERLGEAGQACWVLQDVLQMDSDSKRGPLRAKRDHNVQINQSSAHLVRPQRCHLLREAPVAVIVCTKSVPHHRHMRRQVLPCSAFKEASQAEGLVGMVGGRALRCGPSLSALKAGSTAHPIPAAATLLGQLARCWASQAVFA